MGSINSFKGYGKVDEAEQQAFRRKTRRRFIILTVSSIVLLAVIIGAVVGIVVHKRNNNTPSDSVPPPELTPAASLKAVCDVTVYPSSCYSSISALETSNNTDPEVLFKLSLQVAMNELSKLKDYPTKLIESSSLDGPLKAALNVCATLFDDAVDRLNDSIASMAVGQGQKSLTTAKIDDMKTWLSTSITDQETCLDALQELNTTKYFNSTVVEEVRKSMENSTEFVSNSLAIVARIITLLSGFNIPIHRRLLGFGGNHRFPGWISFGDRRLLQESNPPPNVTVAKDESGDVKTVGDAVEKIPKKSTSRFIIYVKEGKYVENVILDKNMWNVMIYGDGKTKTIITGSRNFVDGTPTFSTATFAVAGKGFIAKGIKFMNTAGPEKHQAVAFRSGSDMSVYYQCAFDAFQDTLYPHSNRQFYSECDITGTIDFIFGNAAVVFQNCNIQPRQPLPNQFNTITAQGKKDPNQNTGISIQKCTLSASSNVTAPTYLGRPWKQYSTTVIMQSKIGAFLKPEGWIPWVTDVDPPPTIFYGEYMNSGPGSAVDQRVKWAGYRPSLTADQARKYTVGSFLQGSEWLPATRVAFESNL